MSIVAIITVIPSCQQPSSSGSGMARPPLQNPNPKPPWSCRIQMIHRQYSVQSQLYSSHLHIPASSIWLIIVCLHAWQLTTRAMCIFRQSLPSPWFFSQNNNREVQFSMCIDFSVSPSGFPEDTLTPPIFTAANEDTSHWWSSKSFYEAPLLHLNNWSLNLHKQCEIRLPSALKIYTLVLATLTQHWK